MRKLAIVLAPLLVLALILTAVGCGGDDEATPKPTQTPIPTGGGDATPTPAPTGGGYTGGSYTFKVSHQSPTATFTSEMWEFIGERFDYYTDGEVKLEVFPMGSLYRGPEEVDAVSTGALDMLMMSDGYFVLGGLSDFMVGFLAFFWGETREDSRAHDVRFLEHPDGGVQMMEQLGDIGIKGIGYLVGEGFSMVINNKGVELKTYYESAGWKSMSIGGMSDMIVEEVGWTPVELDTAESQIAFEQGLIDSLTSSPSAVLSYGYNEWIHSGLMSSPIASHTTWILSLQTWNKLSPELQDIIQNKIYPELYDYYWDNSPKRQRDDMVILENQGFKITWIGLEERIQHRDGMMALAESKGYMLLFNPELIKLADTLRSEPYDETGPYDGMYYNN